MKSNIELEEMDWNKLEEQSREQIRLGLMNLELGNTMLKLAEEKLKPYRDKRNEETTKPLA